MTYDYPIHNGCNPQCLCGYNKPLNKVTRFLFWGWYTNLRTKMFLHSVYKMKALPKKSYAGKGHESIGQALKNVERD